MILAPNKAKLCLEVSFDIGYEEPVINHTKYTNTHLLVDMILANNAQRKSHSLFTELCRKWWQRTPPILQKARAKRAHFLLNFEK